MLGIDQDEDVIKDLADAATHAVQMDATDESTLKLLV